MEMIFIKCTGRRKKITSNVFRNVDGLATVIILLFWVESFPWRPGATAWEQIKTYGATVLQTEILGGVQGCEGKG